MKKEEERGTRLLALEYLPNGRKNKEKPNILKPRLLAIEYIPHKPIHTEEIIVIENSSVD